MRILKVDAQGVSHHGDFSLGETEVFDNGYLRVNPSNNDLAIANSILSNVIRIPFDPATGNPDVAQLTVIPMPMPLLPLSMTYPRPNTGHIGRVYGVEYSPDGNFLYYTVQGEKDSKGADARGYVYQVALSTGQQVLLDTHENAGGQYVIGAIQRGPDDILYITQSGERYLAAILNPNQQGSNCNLVWNHLELAEGTLSRMGLPNLLNECVETTTEHPATHGPCSCGTCHEKTEEDVAVINERARGKAHHDLSGLSCNGLFPAICTRGLTNPDEQIEPCFALHWGDSPNDQIESRDTDIFYITAQNPYNDIRFEGLRITAVQLVPDPGFENVSIVPDRLVEIGCLEPCSSQSREFTIITWDRDSAGQYELQVCYCYDKISLAGRGNHGEAAFPVEMVQD